MPNTLLNLTSQDEATRRHGLAALYNNLNRQGAIYEATPVAVPFLIELAGMPETPERALILILLARIAEGYSFLEVQERSPEAALQRDTREFQERLAAERAWVRDARSAVRKGVKLYVQMLYDPDPSVRMAATRVLASFPEELGQLTRPLERVLYEDPDERVNASALYALAHLSGYAYATVERLALPRLRDARPLVRFVAALLLVQSSKANAPDAARRIVLRTIAEPGAVAAGYDDLPWGTYGAVYDASEALRALPRDLLPDALPALLAALPSSDTPTCASLASTLLTLAFGPPEQRQPQRDGAALTDDERAVLAALVTCDAAWHLATYLPALLQPLGLPMERGALRHYLAAIPASDSGSER